MSSKRKKRKMGAILFEAALSMSLNLLFIIGGLETGWYLYVRQGVSGAAGQAVESMQGQSPLRAARVYMIAMGFSDDIVDALTVVSSTQTISGTKRDTVTVSLPISKALLFAGDISKLGLSGQSVVTSTAYMRQMKPLLQ